MILTVDIGNTTIALGLCQQLTVIRIERVDSTLSEIRLKAELRKRLRSFNQVGKCFRGAIISSVVPEITGLVEDSIRNNLKIEPKVVGRDVFVPLRNLYKNPKQVGQDRLVGSYAALKLYGKPVIVIDLGTAITFDVVSSKGEYLGGAIAPGLRLSAESLFLKTALLPKIAIKAPQSIIGRTTEESMLSGLFYGYGSLCRGMIDLISSKLKAQGSSQKSFHQTAAGSVKVVMTGGHTYLMKKFISPTVRIIDDHLVHKGLVLLAD